MAIRHVRHVLLLTLLAALPRPTAAAEFDRLFFAIDTTMHWPDSLEADDTSAKELPLSGLRPAMHELSLAYGAGTSALQSDVLMRVGYRFARGEFPIGSRIDASDATRYSLSGVPIFVGFQMTLLETLVRPLLDIELGGTAASITYERAQETALTSGRKWCWGLRGGIGAHVGFWEWVALRVLLGGEWAQELWMERGPAVTMTHVGLTLAVIAQPPLPADQAKAEPTEKDLLRSYTPAENSGRSGEAFAAIRDGDLAMRRRDFIAAEAKYKRGVALLPRDQETRVNVEVPVRADWARALIEIGRGEEAVVVLIEALRIDPKSARAQAIVDELRRRGIRFTIPEPERAVEPLY